MSTRAVGLGSLLLLACTRGGSPPSVEPDHTNPSPVPIAEVPEAERCDTAACLSERAAEAADAGMLDVASAHRGAAYRIEPSEGALVAWLEALRAAGQHRALARALESEADAFPTVAEAQPPVTPGVDRPLQPGSATPEIADGLRAEAAGRIDDAIAALGGATEPADLARLGDLHWRAGSQVEARRAWARARVELDERGATLRLAPVHRWYTNGIAWVDDQITVLHQWRPIEIADHIEVSELRRIAVGPDAGVRRSVVMPDGTMVAIPTADGRSLVRASTAGLQLVDLDTGRPTTSLGPIDGRVGALATAGTGDDLLVVVAMGERTELRSSTGEVLATYELHGTTPTITRVYRAGQGTHHDNILDDSPTWPVSAAVSDDGRWVAIGGSDSKVRLFDRERNTTRELAYEWRYEERRHQGANPDLNLPLDMVLVGGGDELVVVYRHGDIIRWRTRDGRARVQLSGRCTKQEATVTVNRYTPPDQPKARPTAMDQVACGHAPNGRLSRDGRTVVTSGSLGSGLRVRDASTGRGLAMITDSDLPDDLLALSPSGRLALTNVHGRPWLWGPDDGLTAPFGRERVDTGPIDPRLSADGRTLSFDLGSRIVTWDLLEERDTSPVLSEGEMVRSRSPDGAWLLVLSRRGLELRSRAGEVRWSRPADSTLAGFSADGSKAVLSTYEDSMRILELESGKEVVLQRTGSNRSYSLSADGSRIVLYGFGGTVQVLDTVTGELVVDLRQTAEAAVLAPDGSWVAWLEQGGQDEQGATKAFAHLRRLGRDPGPDRTLALDGWAKELVVSPGGEELLVVTESRIARWWLPDDSRRDVPELGYVWPNRIRYSPDGRQLLLEGYDRIEIRDNADGIRLLATLYPQLDGGWGLMSAAGAVDGSASAPEHFMTVAEGPGDRLVHGGTLAWDRFAVDELYRRVRSGELVAPPMEAAPRPVLE